MIKNNYFTQKLDKYPNDSLKYLVNLVPKEGILIDNVVILRCKVLLWNTDMADNNGCYAYWSREDNALLDEFKII